MYWSLERTLHTDMNFILVANKGHEDMLKAIFGSKTPPNTVPKGADGKPLTLSAAAFDANFPAEKPTTLRRKR